MIGKVTEFPVPGNKKLSVMNTSFYVISACLLRHKGFQHNRKEGGYRNNTSYLCTRATAGKSTVCTSCKNKRLTYAWLQFKIRNI